MLLARSGVPGAAGVPQRSASATSALPLYSPTRHCVASSWSIQGGPFGQHSATTCRSALRPDETAEQALERRLRESETVEQRVSDVYTQEDLQRALDAAGDKLVVLEIQSEKLCQTGFDDEPELHWQLDKKAEELARLAKCLSVKHVFARTARECPDVQFLSIQADSDGACTLCDTLGVDVLPTLQFYRNGRKLWEHRGVTAAEQDLGEGVLFYGNAAGKGVRGSDFVTELRSKDELTAFVTNQPPNVLTVVNVALESAPPCIRIFPAVLALAKNFVGHASFARLLGDYDSPGTMGDAMQQLLRDYNVVEVPTFLFFRNGKEVGRHVGSSRGDLIGQILQQQSSAGIAPPPPPPGSVKARVKTPFRAPPAKGSRW